MKLFSFSTRRAALSVPLIAALSLTPIVPARADQSDQIVFDVVLKGIRAGELAINGKIVGDGYGANGVLKTAGLVGLFRKIRYDATVSGHYANGTFTPMRFSEKSDTPNSKATHEIVYKNGTPVAVSRNPPRAPSDRDVDPAKQTGTLDPLTALYAVLRNVDTADACKLDVKMYDGAKRSQVRLFDPRPDGKGVVCSGEYRRLAGFSKSDMAEKSRFPFTLYYEPSGPGRLQVDRIETDTIYGKGSLKRQ
ncbi:DUF3108 domain-containing protein [Thioclava sp. BHET1]|uniref:DUF3108 domain-containing protein n=1 Tax=Thioclava dalianensis TaxID=1185766 RepID=A0A074TJ87_9RHOB|nr:DUF3108 domain-containing protein [Thioclava dalianensis]KEP69078.1 hypothetical protein DL1_05660 [Thioclava dalianensis]TMV90521.1 DUF3108 domain-containing protein [Thioclava sp. BHET1]SFM83977.1 Protein of unknown function [Thioclava dalianensis]